MSIEVSFETVPPLDGAPLLRYADPPATKWLMWLPPLGWILNHWGWQRWAGPERMKYETTLRARPEIPVDIWGNTDRQAVAAALLNIIDDNFGWPNARFVPWDPVVVVMWAYEDGLDDTAAINDIEQAFSVIFTVDEWLAFYRKSLLDLVEGILERRSNTA